MRRAIAAIGKILLVLVALPVAVVVGVFAYPKRRGADEVASYLRAFINGGGDEWDWDDFTSVPIADPELDSIRRRADAVELPVTDGGALVLRDLLAEAERLAA